MQYCNNDKITAPEGECWNGTSPIEERNSTHVVSPPLIQEQIYTLEVWIGKLQGAYQGQDVDLVDDSEESLESSGSGSGDFEPTSDLEIDMGAFTEPPTTTTEPTTTTTKKITKPPPRTASSASLPSLSSALFHYILPIIFVWFGGAITDLL